MTENKPKVGLILNKWKMKFDVELKDEDVRIKERRSFLHFIATNIPMIDAKARATEWLLSDIPKVDEVIEFFGGVGLSSTIIRGILQPSSHWIGEIDENCVRHLKKHFSADKVTVEKINAYRSMRTKIYREPNTRIAAFLDFSTFSILDFIKKKNVLESWLNVLKYKPDVLGFTDTTLSRFHTHRKQYTKFFCKIIRCPKDYFTEFSNWLYQEFQYSIVKTAYRSNKVTYNICLPGKHMYQEKKFQEENKGYGFRWLKDHEIGV